MRKFQVGVAAAMMLALALPANASHSSGSYGGGGGPESAISYVNPDTGAATANPDVDPGSNCSNPDSRDAQQLSSSGTTNRNVHNDGCLFAERSYGGQGTVSTFDGQATYDSSGAGYISACPDPDNAGPKTSRTVDRNGDGLADLCIQTGFQQKGTAGDGEFHARLNNNTKPGQQKVVFCYDPDGDGCSDESVTWTTTVDWANTPGSARSYINPDTGAATANTDVDPGSNCSNPDSYDTQQLSTPGMTNRNVHNDGCLYVGGSDGWSGYSFGDIPNRSTFDGQATYDSSGAGYISACPDPDNAGPKTSRTVDRNGDGLADLCTQTGFQQKGTAGDGEFHARLNNNRLPGQQKVVFCYDPDGDGCSDESVTWTVRVDWVS